MENLSHHTDLIQRYLNGSSPRSELLELLTWLKQSEEHVRYFNQVCNAWDGGGLTSQNQQQTELALVRLHKRISEVSAPIVQFPKTKPSNRLWWFTRVAAVFVGAILMVSAGWFFSRKFYEGQPGQFVSALAPPSQKSQLVLSDGTRVWLNSGSRLRYSTVYGNKLREVYLEGEAYFQVAKNPSKPFLVHASQVVVKALGTSFNVKCYAADKTIETTLVEGKVEVTGKLANKNSGPKVILKPNEKATFAKSAQTLVVSRFSDEKAPHDVKHIEAVRIENSSIATVISWKEQLLMFENETFENLVIQLERWYDVKITVQNPNLNNNKYTGTFGNNESVEQVLKVISRTTPMHYTIKDKNIIIE